MALSDQVARNRTSPLLVELPTWLPITERAREDLAVAGDPGVVAWWPRPDVLMVNVIAQVLAETNRHAGHADILREQLDGSTGDGPEASHSSRDAGWWRAHVAVVETSARRARLSFDTAADDGAHRCV